jgi:TDG/mug DNA glycosylase family protein
MGKRKTPIKMGEEKGVEPHLLKTKVQNLTSTNKLNVSKEAPQKVRKRVNRFNGLTEEEVAATRSLPDYIKNGLDILFIGINPGLVSAYKGNYYSSPGNHFWKALYLSGLVSNPVSPTDDHLLLEDGFGFTDVVKRATPKSADLQKKELIEGSVILKEKLVKYQPKIAVFNGKYIYEIFSGQKKFLFGRQPDKFPGTNTWLWVMPSSSPRCAQLPRVSDKVPFFEGLKKFRDYLNGDIANLDEAEVVFSTVTLSKKPIAIKIEPSDNTEECAT